MALDPVDQTFVDYCYKELKEGIIRGEFAPGEKLRIAHLKARFKVGPTPIREALSRLISSGLIEAEANRGFFVKKVSEPEVRDIYSTFNKIELLALNQAMELGDISWEAEIIGALHKLTVVETRYEPIDSDHWLDVNYAFHRTLVSACGSPSLLKIREDLYQLFDRYCHLSLLSSQEALLINNQEHHAIAQAVLKRDKESACILITLHLEKSLACVIAAFKKNNLF